MVLVCLLRSISFPQLYGALRFAFSVPQETWFQICCTVFSLEFCYFSSCLSVSSCGWPRVAFAPRAFIIENERQKPLGTKTPQSRVSYPPLSPGRILCSPNPLPSTEIVANLPRIFATLSPVLKWFFLYFKFLHVHIIVAELILEMTDTLLKECSIQQK